MAAGYMMVSAAIGFVTSSIKSSFAAHREQIANQKKALDLAREFAKVQQESAKNLSGQDRKEFLSKVGHETIAEIQREAINSHANEIADAYASAEGVAGAEMAKLLTIESARSNRLTPELIEPTNKSAAGLVYATGIASAKEAFALVNSFGQNSNIKKGSDLTIAAAEMANFSTAAFPKQDRVEATKDALSIHALVGKFDNVGNTTTTGVGGIIDKIGSFYNPTEQDLVQLNEKIRELEVSQAIKFDDQFDIAHAFMAQARMPANSPIAEKLQGEFDKKLQSLGIDSEERKTLEGLLKERTNLESEIRSLKPGSDSTSLRKELDDVIARMKEFYSTAGLTPTGDRELDELKARQRAASSGKTGLLESLMHAAQDPTLRRMTEAAMQYLPINAKPTARKLLEPDSKELKELLSVRDALTTSPQYWEDIVANMEASTVQKTVVETEKVKTVDNIRILSDQNAIMNAAMRESADVSLEGTYVGGWSKAFYNGTGLNRLMGEYKNRGINEGWAPLDASEGAEYTMSALTSRANDLGLRMNSGHLIPDVGDKVALLAQGGCRFLSLQSKEMNRASLRAKALRRP